MIPDIKNTNKNFSAQVVILAGGFGKRLEKVIGKNIPKPMALFDKKPLLHHQIELCVKHGFTRILILVHHLPEVIENYLKDGEWLGADIRYSYEESPRGTAGAVADAITHIDQRFIVIYGDTFLNVNLSKFFISMEPSDSVLTFAHPNSHPFDSDLLKLNEDNIVKEVFRPSKAGMDLYNNIVNAALYVCKKDVFKNFVPNKGMYDISSQLFNVLIENSHNIRAYRSVEYIKDVGTEERFKKVKNEIFTKVPERLSHQNKKTCIFLDRDGVINKEVGHISNKDRFELLPEVSKAISKLNSAGILVICVTNQPVIARGDITIDGLNTIHMKMEALLGHGGAYLDEIYFCPHHPDSGYDGEIKELKIKCDCRKPNPGMLLAAIKKYNVDVNKSWMIGDHMRDIEAGKKANLNTVLITSNNKNSLENGSDYIFSDLNSAIEYLLPNLVK